MLLFHNRSNGGSCIDGVSPCTAAEYIRLPGEVITVEGYSLDVDNSTVLSGGNTADLTLTETALLRTLMRAPGVVFSRRNLHTRRPSRRSESLQTIHTEISHLDRKLSGLTDQGESVIVSVPREGYRFGPERETPGTEALRAEGYVLGYRTLSSGGETIDVTGTQRAILGTLMGSPGVVISKEDLNESRPIRRRDHPDAVRHDITSIRGILDRLPGPGGNIVATVRGKGYRFGQEKPQPE